MVTDHSYYDKIHEEDLTKILNHLGVKKIVLGHSMVNEISSDFNGKVIRIDVQHGIQKKSGLTRGLLIENGKEYSIDDLGNRTLLKSY